MIRFEAAAIVVLPVKIESRSSDPLKSEKNGTAMNSAPADVPCTQNSEAAEPEMSAISPTARLNALEPVEQGGARAIIVPVFTMEPAVARTVVVLSEAWAVSIAPAPKLSAVTIDVSA